MIRNILRRLRGPRKYILYLARRGRPLIIEEIVAYSIEEAKEEAEAIIDSLNPEEMPDLTKYRYFIIKSEDGKEMKRIRNPFQEEKAEISMKDIEQVTLASIVEAIPEIVKQSVNMVTAINTRIMNALIDSYLQSLGLKQADKTEKLLEVIGKVAEAYIEDKREERERRARVAEARPRLLDRRVWKRLVESV